MNKKEILEIKKQFTPVNCGITRIATCYVDYEKNILLNKVEAFLSLPEEEQFKYYDILKKSLSGGKGKTLYDIEFVTNDGGTDEENFLNELRKSKLQDEELLEQFYDKIIDTYDYGENYLIVLVHGLYDIPGKASDEMTMHDASEGVYEYIVCCICPVGLSKPGLSINAKESKVENRIRDWIVDMPAHGFLYPAFNDRSMDIHSLLYYTKKMENMQEEFAFKLTGCPESLLSNAEEHAILADIMQTENTVNFDMMKNISCNACAAMNELSDEEMCMSQQQFTTFLKDAGMPEETAEMIAASYKKRLGDSHEISLASMADKSKAIIKTGTSVIKTDSECIHELETRKINGRVYLMIPVHDNLIEVNGVEVLGDK